MHLIRVFRSFVQQNMKEAFAYRVDTFINVGMTLMWQFWEIAALAIIFSNAETLGGWRLGDMIVLMGIFRIIMMFMFSIVWPNTEKFNQGIREGTLDYTLLQPLDSQFAVSFQKMVVWRVLDLVIAVILISTGLFFLGSRPSLIDLAVFLILAISGAVVIYSLWIALIALTFWFTKFDNNVTLMSALMDSGRYPATIYPAWLRVIVTFVVPVAVATTIPLQGLRGELAAWQIGLALAGGVLAFVLSRLIWRAGVKRYSGASA
jgi:ABC-2 type transport system permease protein